jgi:peptide/nickel transport system permease protein
MRALRFMALCLLATVGLLSLTADLLARHDYATQFREHANERPSRVFPLGTDELGRDRFSRLLYGTRVSLLLAPLTALLATGIAAAVGVAAGYLGGWVDRAATGCVDLFLSLPWLFLLLTLRALLPLNISSSASLAATFLLLGLVGWASGARVVRASAADLRDSAPILYARSCGCGGLRLLWRHFLPNLKPVLTAQFWILVPVFLLTEANLGVLGLGVGEPMPSWGNLLSELQNYQRIPEAPWILIPAALLVTVVASLHFAFSSARTWE